MSRQGLRPPPAGRPGGNGSERNQEERCGRGDQVGPRLLPELLELARASPDPLVLSAPGAWSWDGVGALLSGALAELSRELLLELGAVVSRCCCSGPGTLRAFSAGRCGWMGRRGGRAVSPSAGSGSLFLLTTSSTSQFARPFCPRLRSSCHTQHLQDVRVSVASVMSIAALLDCEPKRSNHMALCTKELEMDQDFHPHFT